MQFKIQSDTCNVHERILRITKLLVYQRAVP